MAGFQFMHVQTYSQKGNKANRGYADVLLENSRVPGNFPHVKNAKLPKLIYGNDPADLIGEIEQRVNQAKAKLRGTGKRIQSSTHILNGSVYSHPIPVAQLEIGDKQSIADYIAWRKSACQFAIEQAEQNGTEVLSIVEHTDETYPHIHVLAVPKLTAENPRLDAKACHVGHVAAKQAYDATMTELKAQGKSPSECKKSATNAQTRAYKDAMSELQDSYHDKVSVKHGQLRYGPRRARLSTRQYKAMQKQAEYLVSLDKSVELSKEELREYKGAINEINALYGENDKLTVEVNTLSTDNSNLQNENEALKRALSDLNNQHDNDLKVMQENSAKEVLRLQNEIDRLSPRPSLRR